jgi:ribosomal protein S16
MRNATILFLLLIGTVYILTPSGIVPKPDITPLIYYSKCDKPVGYHIGRRDVRFGLSEKDILAYTADAAGIWNTQAGKTLFTYDRDGQLSIDMIYDTRQTLTSEINQMEEKLNSDKRTLQEKVDAFNADATQFKKDLASLNERVSYWNSHGGAPSDEYDKLIAEQARLKSEAGRLNQTATQLNLTSGTFNIKIDELNQTIGEFNKEINRKPELGYYDDIDNSITIYFYTNNNELTHTLAHEMGHVLGLSHDNNQSSLMYAYTSDITKLNSEDIQNLTEVCRKKSVWELFVWFLGKVWVFVSSPDFVEQVKTRFTLLDEIIHRRVLRTSPTH